MPEQLFAERLKRVNDAVALKELDKMPIIVATGTLPYYIDRQDATNRDNWYDFEAAGQSQVRYHEEFRPGIAKMQLQSGRANEIAGTKMIDWPGNPGTSLGDNSSHQVIEHEFMTDDEYPEFIHDSTGFMLQKYIPRAFPNLAGLVQLCSTRRSSCSPPTSPAFTARARLKPMADWLRLRLRRGKRRRHLKSTWAYCRILAFRPTSPARLRCPLIS